MSYTPGPWEARFDDDEWAIWFQYHTECGGEYCSFNVIGVSAEADACLIAAAPDMLEALRMVLDDPGLLDGRPSIYECVRAAFAKAQGEVTK